jgi:hypothetical protein
VGTSELLARARRPAPATTSSRRSSTAAPPDPIGQLRAVYPNALSIERPLYEAIGSGELRRPRPGSVGDLELFGTFFRYATGDDLSAAERAELAAVIDALDRRRREAGG